MYSCSLGNPEKLENKGKPKFKNIGEEKKTKTGCIGLVWNIAVTVLGVLAYFYC